MADAFRVYGLVVAMWVRSTLVYRATFCLLLFSQVFVTSLEFVAILIMFANTRALGGFSLAEVALLYGASGIAMGFADLFVGSIETIGGRIRDGSLDVMLIRPASAYAQAAGDRFALRRLGRVSQAALVFGYGLAVAPVDWTALRVLLVPVMVVSGAVIFAAIFTLGAAFQFVSKDAAEVANAFTYGGNVLTQYPPTVFTTEIIRSATFVLPLAFVSWLPSSYLLARPMPGGLPSWFAFCSPAAALALAAVTALVWTTAVRSYRSTGS